VSNIKKRSSEYLGNFNENAPNYKYRKLKSTENEEINKAVFDWFKRARTCNIPISGPILQEVALKFAQGFKIQNFTASNGWLECFKRRNQIVFRVLSGEQQSADFVSANDYKQKLPQICTNYKPQDIFNADETGLFYRALPEKSLVEKFEKCKGNKMLKERVSILLCANAKGEKLMPLVINRFFKPRCFKNLLIKDLPVIWKSNSNAWMTSAIFEEWLINLNRKFVKEKRNVLLFVDNCSSHVEMELSNIKICFLPPNTTSLIQPLDYGIINTFKRHYRKYVLQYIISQFESNKRFDVKNISVLDAIHWISNAWSNVKAETIVKSFSQCGFPVSEVSVIDNESENINDLINYAKENKIVNECVNAETFVSFDNNIETSNIPASDCDQLIAQIAEEKNAETIVISDEDCDNLTVKNYDEQECNNYGEIAQMINKIKRFAVIKESKLIPVVMEMEKQFSEIQVNRIKLQKEKPIYEYFNRL
jgi:hypothetical protein